MQAKVLKAPHGRWPRVTRFVTELDQARFWGTVTHLSVPVLGAAVGFLQAVNAAWWSLVPIALLIVVEAVLLMARGQGRRNRFHEACERGQRFLNALHNYLLNDDDDLRVTLLLPFRDQQRGDVLRPLLRHGNHQVVGRWPRIGAKVDGVAGRVWIKGQSITAGYTKRYEECLTDAEREEYRERMYSDETFLAEGGPAGSPKYVYACVLRVDGNKAAVLCIDGRVGANVVGSAIPVTEMHGNQREFIQAQLIEGLIKSASQHLAIRAVGRLYRYSGVTPDDDD